MGVAFMIIQMSDDLFLVFKSVAAEQTGQLAIVTATTNRGKRTVVAGVAKFVRFNKSAMNYWHKYMTK